MKILKFGGSSLASFHCVDTIVAIVEKETNEHKVVLVVSALEGITDLLLDAGQLAAIQNPGYHTILSVIENKMLNYTRSLLPVTTQSATLSMVKQYVNQIEDICDGICTLKEMSARTSDMLLAYGELITSKVISEHMRAVGIKHVWFDARDVLETDSNYGRAAVLFANTNRAIRERIGEITESVVIVPGFVASDSNGNTTTLGRGGSDYTAALFAAALNASEMEIWTDVNGMMTADPRIVKNVKTIRTLSYHEAMELSHFGAKVLYPPAVQPVMLMKIPLRIKNTFAPTEEGTLICDQSLAASPNDNICGISNNAHIVLLNLEGTIIVGIPGFSRRLFTALATQNINVALITQSSSEYSMCVAIKEEDKEKAVEAVHSAFATEFANGTLAPIKVETSLAMIALVGESMVNLPGISGRMFSVLGRNGVNIRAIAQGSSERNISAVIARSDLKKALNALHEQFFESVYKQINLFVVGVGNVGSRLMEQLRKQAAYLQEHLRLQVRLIGVSNSTTMVFEEDGIEWDNWRNALSNGRPMQLDQFVEHVIELNKRNSIFVDNTACDEVANVYATLLRKSISVVTCNKIACSSDYTSYKHLKSLAQKYNAQFLFETNVGAGLPVINTLNDLLRSGDKINRIHAVLSGTMNFVFNEYDGTRTFAEVVKQAQDEGYTEPDPRLDLSGLDVMRKIVILAREAGRSVEMSEIRNDGFLPQSCFDGDVTQFYHELAKHEAHFQKLYSDASAAGKRLKYLASIDGDTIQVGLEAVSSECDFFNLDGKDNAVLFYTNRYPEQPLVIKGAGAGAEVTASGLFSDIIRAARITHS